MSQSEIWEKHGFLREQSITSKNGKSIMKVFHFVMLTKKGKKKDGYFCQTISGERCFLASEWCSHCIWRNLDSFGQNHDLLHAITAQVVLRYAFIVVII